MEKRKDGLAPFSSGECGSYFFCYKATIVEHIFTTIQAEYIRICNASLSFIIPIDSTYAFVNYTSKLIIKFNIPVHMPEEERQLFIESCLTTLLTGNKEIFF